MITSVMETDWRYFYQGQERQDELGLNWDSFKWRNYDYAIGRFMSVDPLAEGYEWQSVFAFGSNQPVHAKEIEGLESGDDKSVMNRFGDAVMSSMRWVNENINPLTPIVETITGTSYESNWTEEKPRLQSASEAGMSIIPGGKVVGTGEKMLVKAIYKNVAKKATLEANKAVGKEGEKIVTESLSKEFLDKKILNQVTGKFDDGTKTIIDNIVVDLKTNKTILTNETKTGGAKLSPQQTRRNNGESVTLTGKNAGTVNGQTINTSNTANRTSRVDVETKKIKKD